MKNQRTWNDDEHQRKVYEDQTRTKIVKKIDECRMSTKLYEQSTKLDSRRKSMRNRKSNAYEDFQNGGGNRRRRKSAENQR